MKKILTYFICLTLTLCVFLPQGLAFSEETVGTTYYFDSVNGKDTNDGLTENTAKKTPRRILSTLSPGDKVLLKRGCVFSTTQLKITASGEKTAPITFSCYGNEEESLPVVQGKGSAENVILISSADYIVIDSLHIISGFNKIGTAATCIKLQSANGRTIMNTTVKNCVLEGDGDNWDDAAQSGLDGINVEAENWYGFFDGITIENNEIYNVKGVGININGCHGGCDENGVVTETSAKNVVIRNNFLYNIGKDGIKVVNCNAPLIEYNTCGKSHSFAKTTWHVAIWPFTCYKAVFQYNEAYDTKTTYDGQGFDCDYQCYDTLFQYNYSHDNEGGFMLICTEPSFMNGTAFNIRPTVRYNISQNDMNTLIALTGHINDTRIYNNTIYSDKAVNRIVNVYSRDEKTYPVNTKIYNNIFYTSSGSFNWQTDTGTDYFTTGTEFKNNLVYGDNYIDYPQNDTSVDDNDKIESSDNIYNQDPIFVKNGGAKKGLASCYAYKLQSGSPALKSGRIITDDNAYDFFGNEVNNTDTPNIGAYNGEGFKFITGDINSDEGITAADILYLQKYLLKYYDESDFIFTNADLNNDDVINLLDYVLLRKLLAQNS